MVFPVRRGRAEIQYVKAVVPVHVLTGVHFEFHIPWGIGVGGHDDKMLPPYAQSYERLEADRLMW